ncbi:hypothetical protein BDR05DRAFT_38142 [Suillus weaverae]|nr:hypothetical protein BDR05DRAFT_38142 [Suillus weaverae]
MHHVVNVYHYQTCDTRQPRVYCSPLSDRICHTGFATEAQTHAAVIPVASSHECRLLQYKLSDQPGPPGTSDQVGRQHIISLKSLRKKWASSVLVVQSNKSFTPKITWAVMNRILALSGSIILVISSGHLPFYHRTCHFTAICWY